MVAEVMHTDDKRLGASHAIVYGKRWAIIPADDSGPISTALSRGIAVSAAPPGGRRCRNCQRGSCPRPGADEPRRPGNVFPTVATFLLWLILLVFAWPLALLALMVYPVVWLILLPFRIVGLAVDGVLHLLRAVLRLPGRLLGAGA
jgi:hypothetical protein